MAGTTLVPKKNVAILFAIKEVGLAGYADPPSRLKPVSSRNKRTSTKAKTRITISNEGENGGIPEIAML